MKKWPRRLSAYSREAQLLRAHRRNHVYDPLEGELFDLTRPLFMSFFFLSNLIYVCSLSFLSMRELYSKDASLVCGAGVEIYDYLTD